MTRKKTRLRGQWALALCCLSLAGESVRAQVPLEAPPLAQQAPPRPQEAEADGTPRGAVRAYLEACRAGDYERAARYLDLSRFAEASRSSEGRRLARHLKVVLDQTLWIDLKRLSDSAEGLLEDGLPPELERVGTLRTEKGEVDVLLSRVAGEESRLVWKFSAATVASIPRLYEELGYGVFGELLPEVFFTVRFLEIELWQWIGLLLTVAFAVGAAWLLGWLLHRGARRLIARAETTTARRMADAALKPVRYGLALAGFALGSHLLGLSVPALELMGHIERGLALLILTWLAFALTDVAVQVAAERLEAKRQKAALAVLPLGRRTVKVAFATLAGISLLQNLGFHVTGLLAGLGVGGIAVALAAQKTLENFFGGLTLILDQPVRVGDFCKFGDRVGTVEDVGLRSTRLRTLDRTMVSVPNADFSQTQIENFGARDRIRLYAVLGVRYETSPDQLRYLLSELRRLLWAHPKIETDSARVRFVQFGAYSLDLEVFAYVLTLDWNEFLAVREDIFLRMMETVSRAGTGFAFPSHTSYLRRDDGVDEHLRKEAEAKVQQWRQDRRLPFPSLPEDEIAKIKGTIDYPPEGTFTKG